MALFPPRLVYVDAELYLIFLELRNGSLNTIRKVKTNLPSGVMCRFEILNSKIAMMQHRNNNSGDLEWIAVDLKTGNTEPCHAWWCGGEMEVAFRPPCADNVVAIIADSVVAGEVDGTGPNITVNYVSDSDMRFRSSFQLWPDIGNKCPNTVLVHGCINGIEDYWVDRVDFRTCDYEYTNKTNADGAQFQIHKCADITIVQTGCSAINKTTRIKFLSPDNSELTRLDFNKARISSQDNLLCILHASPERKIDIWEMPNIKCLVSVNLTNTPKTRVRFLYATREDIVEAVGLLFDCTREILLHDLCMVVAEYLQPYW